MYEIESTPSNITKNIITTLFIKNIYILKAIYKNCFASDLRIFLETYRGASLQCIAGYATPKEIERFRQKT